MSLDTWKPYLRIHNRVKDSKIHLQFNTSSILVHHKLTSIQLLPFTTKKATNIYFLKSTASTTITQAANTNFNKPSSFSIILHFNGTSSVLAVCTIGATTSVPANHASTMALSCCLDASASTNARSMWPFRCLLAVLIARAWSRSSIRMGTRCSRVGGSIQR